MSNKKGIIIAAVAVCLVFVIAAVARQPHTVVDTQDASGTTETTKDTDTADVSGTDTNTTSGSDTANDQYATWATTVNAICKEQFAQYQEENWSPIAYLREVPQSDGYRPVPADALAQDFDGAVANLMSASSYQGSVQGNNLKLSEAMQQTQRAQEAVAVAAGNAGLTYCARLAQH